MTEHVLRPGEEVEQVFDKLDTLFDLQVKRLEDTPVLSVVERKKLEMSGNLDLGIPDSDELAREAPGWYDGYRYGLYRGYWRALSWVLNERDESYNLLNED